MATIFIYGLIDPRTEKVRYIGKTVNLKARLRSHIWLARANIEDTHKARRIRQVLNAGLQPTITTLVTTDSLNWQEEERKLIAETDGLTNTSRGGDGVDAPRTPEWRARIGDAHRGKKISEEVKSQLKKINLEKHAAGCKNGHPWTEENTTICKRGNNTYRQCRICRNETDRQWRAKQPKKERKPRVGKLQEFCKNGHPLSGDNLRVYFRRGRTERLCKTCLNIRNAKAKKVTKQRALNRIQPPKHKLDTYCKNGHEYNENTIGYDRFGYRLCKECRKERDRRRRKGD